MAERPELVPEVLFDVQVSKTLMCLHIEKKWSEKPDLEKSRQRYSARYRIVLRIRREFEIGSIVNHRKRRHNRGKRIVIRTSVLVK